MESSRHCNNVKPYAKPPKHSKTWQSFQWFCFGLLLIKILFIFNAYLNQEQPPPFLEEKDQLVNFRQMKSGLRRNTEFNASFPVSSNGQK